MGFRDVQGECLGCVHILALSWEQEYVMSACPCQMQPGNGVGRTTHDPQLELGKGKNALAIQCYNYLCSLALGIQDSTASTKIHLS